MLAAAMRFDVVATDPSSQARLGELTLPHGVVRTPAFMPVGTQATVKTLTSEDVEALGYEIILANTYHLHLRPGEELINRHGGLHRFMNWKRPILTDSGGYQVMSLSKTRKITEDGVLFRSHLDGTEIFLSPEMSIQIQSKLGVDISMALDVCPNYPATKQEIAHAMKLTHSWAPKNLGARSPGQVVFGIVQGGEYEDLRRESAEYLSTLAFDGFAIGGVSVGEPSETQGPVVQFTAPRLPIEKPRYLMGVGQPNDIIHAVKCGIDLFDCVLPTRMARHHALYTLDGVVTATNSKWADHNGPFDEQSVFPGLEGYSAAYIRHLFKAKEPLAARLATLHNLAFYARLMAEIRETIRNAQWSKLEERYKYFRSHSKE
jgi:queuine tRNA-ribosyltransferase